MYASLLAMVSSHACNTEQPLGRMEVMAAWNGYNRSIGEICSGEGGRIHHTSFSFSTPIYVDQLALPGPRV